MKLPNQKEYICRVHDVKPKIVLLIQNQGNMHLKQDAGDLKTMESGGGGGGVLNEAEIDNVFGLISIGRKYR